MKLFESGHIEDYFRDKHQSLSAKVAQLRDQEILNCDFNEWIAYLTESYQIEPIVLFTDNIQQTINETKVSVYNHWYQYDGGNQFVEVDGYRISYTIPFDGDSRILQLRPSSYILSVFEIDNLIKPRDQEYGSIIMSISFVRSELVNAGDNAKQLVENKFQQEFRSLATEIQYANENVNSYNTALPGYARQVLEERKKKASAFAQVSRVLEIPLPTQKGAENIHPIPLKRITKPVPVAPSVKKPEQEHTISNNDFQRIVSIISSCGTTMENTARSYFDNQEEELRDHLLLGINSQYENATGETFRRVGKTDIRVEFENKAAYIAECKIWHGKKAFADAVTQLLGYCTWRDTKISLVVFNKSNKNFMQIISEVCTWINEHSKCVDRRKKNEWICSIHRDEQNIDVTLHIAVYDLCVDKTEFKDSRFS